MGERERMRQTTYVMTDAGERRKKRMNRGRVRRRRRGGAAATAYGSETETTGR